MKPSNLLPPVLAVTAALLGASVATTVTFVPHDTVRDALAKGAPLVKAGDLLVSGSHRSGPGEPELHETETDVLYILEGEASFVSGGTLVNTRTASSGQLRGTDIRGGQTQHLVKGDLIVIPAGIPHWFKDVPQATSYLTVKVLKP